ncbi:hypothetical protein G6F46_004079 [Rhizopus delemar]|uniref:Magnesium transporter NIPA2 n=2 Tax=Rhizopus TaxID=4842 RepID=A0A9P6Z7Y4_9FUNG|nr:hypothetical protein G6F43_005381 [Rhizopus delemar]KAG1547278.1 hypothetical protein G6F51_004360 [Rhizopus arrhizus]KAG1462629.1 hypothetical protein G6F55_002851 [Rhizopus delemar]KAG1500763.1 hypothetical protein G6F54_003498 [Rhizopus delemar]KAG1515325.1 hypothetical protein G6F53_003000 [Rhizopus delemar]
MSSINGTSNPFGADTTGAQAGLYKGIGVTLAVASGVFIGSSFVFKKKGLLQSTNESGGVAGEGYTYLKSAMWWTGMILMIVGELCNFIAYAFTQAILVTPLGALSVVISAVLSSIFLKEKLSFQGKIGCLQCILGAIIIVLHAPEQSQADTTIETFKKSALSVGFLVYAGLAVCISLFLVFYCGPRWGKKNMLVYIVVCSLIGSISVVFTQGLGSAIVHSITYKNENQFTNWFIYIVLGIVIVTLLVEIVYLNKALNLFNTALVTPTYYVIFTTLTIVSSVLLYKGFDTSGVNIATCVLGFLCICSGIALLHNPKSESALSLSLEEEVAGLRIDEEKGTSISQSPIKSHSVFQMFENNDDENDATITHHNHDNQPGAADLFAAPFSGISRYASTAKRSQTMIVKQRLNNSVAQEITKRRPHSDNVSSGNTTAKNEREVKWEDQSSIDSIDASEHSRSNSMHFKRDKSTSFSSHGTHRAQDELDLISSFKLKINRGVNNDREALVNTSED